MLKDLWQHKHKAAQIRIFLTRLLLIALIFVKSRKFAKIDVCLSFVQKRKKLNFLLKIVHLPGKFSGDAHAVGA